MRHKFLVLTVKKWLKSVYIYGSYRKIKTGVPLFLDHSVYIFWLQISCSVYVPKVMEIVYCQTKLLQKLSGLLFWPTLYTTIIIYGFVAFVVCIDN